MLIDTGARGLTIDGSVVRDLGLEPTGRTEDTHGLTGRSQVAEYEASLLLPLTDWQGNQAWKGFPVCALLMPDGGLFHAEDYSSTRIVGILGRLLLQFATFTYDGLVDGRDEESPHAAFAAVLFDDWTPQRTAP